MKKEIENWLELNPDQVLVDINGKLDEITKYKFDADALLEMVAKYEATITINKFTLEGIIGIQIYSENGEVKIDNI